MFVTIGRVQDVVVPAANGGVEIRKEVILKWTFDERIEDGLYCAKTLDELRVRLESPRAGDGAVALPGAIEPRPTRVVTS